MDTLRALVSVGAPALTVFGVVMAALGTLMICKPYHPFSTFALIRHLLGVLWSFRHGLGEALRLVRITSSLGTINEEDRAKSLVGVYLVFFGFFLQMFGACLWLIDAVVSAPHQAR